MTNPAASPQICAQLSTWGTADFATTSFQLRLTNVATAIARDFYLDWLAVRVYYQ